MQTENRRGTLVLCGFMACGKTSVGKALAKQLGYAFADTDDMLFARTGMTLQQMFAIGGESYFRDREHEIVREAALLPRTVVSTGGGVMTFERNARLLARHARIVHIRRSFDACYACIARRQGRPIAGQKSREQLLAMYEARLPAYEKYASFTLNNDGTLGEALAALTGWLGEDAP